MASLKSRCIPAVPGRRARHAAGFSMLELIVVIAAIVILAAAIAPFTSSWIDQGKAARAQSDAAAVSAAMARFFQDTTRWPGQVEILRSGSSTRFATVGDPAGAFPDVVGPVGIAATTCTSGLSGVTANETTFADATPSASNSLNILDFLMEPPAAADYPNWRGPYLAPGLRTDPWGAVFVINIVPLFCGETVSSEKPAGALGYGWILSGGPNKTIQTPFTEPRVAADSDDVGINLSKRVTEQASP